MLNVFDVNVKLSSEKKHLTLSWWNLNKAHFIHSISTE